MVERQTGIMGKKLKAADDAFVNPREVVTEFKLKGGLVVNILNSLIDTVRSVDAVPEDAMLKTYAAETGDSNTLVDPGAARIVVKGIVQNRWYDVHGKEPSEAAIKRQEERVAAAAKSRKSTASAAPAAKKGARKAAAPVSDTATEAAPAKKGARKAAAPAAEPVAAATNGAPRATGKRGVVREILAAGSPKDIDKIVAAANKKLGNESVTRKDVVWNRNRMIEAGELAAD